MRCPFCHKSNTKVLDSRLLKEETSVRRRRKCEHCHKRFTTYETIEIVMPNIAKLNGKREPYKREKLLAGVEKACLKRPISNEQIFRLIENIEKTIFENSDKEISTKEIGSLVMYYLRNLDPVAYIRFASVYHKFHDIQEFVNNISNNEKQFNNNPN